jgi:hypothetical protein
MSLFFASVSCFNREINVALCAGVFFLKIGKEVYSGKHAEETEYNPEPLQ